MLTAIKDNLKTYLTRILFIIVAVLGITISVLTVKNQDLHKRVSDQQLSIKSLEYGMAEYKDKNGVLHSQSLQDVNTIASLTASKDSINTRFVKLIYASNIKPKDVTQIGTISSVAKVDTVIVFKRLPTKTGDIKFIRDTTIDISHKPYIIEQLHFKGDSLARNLEVYNTADIVWHKKRETIDPPKKFFLFRWFQKKQDIIYVDVSNNNPYIKSTEQTFKIISK